jgi:hypothetical protein
MSTHSTTPISIDSLQSLSWMRGLWIEERVDRRCEEIWSGPDGGTMMGMFRWTSDDEVSFFEFMVIRPSEAGVEFHARHFDPTLVAWEDRERFQAFLLTEQKERQVVFAIRPAENDTDHKPGGWLAYRLVDDDRLDVQLIEATGDVKLTLHFHRQR